VFCFSYLVPRRWLLALQITGAFLWMGFGFLTRAPPVVVSNLIVVLAASISLWRNRLGAGR
jgi:hypothetical protein